LPKDLYLKKSKKKVAEGFVFEKNKKKVAEGFRIGFGLTPE
jgi:hypothetical protein